MNGFDVFKTLDLSFPFSQAEEWDNSGYLVQSDRPVSKILVALDATLPVIEEADRLGAELIVTHHPVIFHPLKVLSPQHPAVAAAVRGIGILSAHTNFDVGPLSADAHLCRALCEKLGFEQTSLLDVTLPGEEARGFGRTGVFPKALSFEALLAAFKKIFGIDTLRAVSGGREIRTLAFCSGGGSEYLARMIDEGFDAYVTADLKHDAFLSAQNAGLSLFCPTHYQMEKPAMAALAAFLREQLASAEVFESCAEQECGQYF